MRVLGDITLNHCGRAHDWFVRAQDPAAPEREFFRFDPELQYGYECWFNVPTLPKFDHTSARLREALVAAEDAPVRSWLRGPTGWTAGGSMSRTWPGAWARSTSRTSSPGRPRRDGARGRRRAARGGARPRRERRPARRRLARDDELCGLHSAGLVLAAQPGVPRDLPGPAGGGARDHRAAGGRLTACLPRTHPLALADRQLEHPRQPRHRAHPHRRRLAERQVAALAWPSACPASRWCSQATRSAPPAGGARTRAPRSRGTTRTRGTWTRWLPTARFTCDVAVPRLPPVACAGCMWAPTRSPSSVSTPTSRSSWWCRSQAEPVASPCPTWRRRSHLYGFEAEVVADHV